MQEIAIKYKKIQENARKEKKLAKMGKRGTKKH